MPLSSRILASILQLGLDWSTKFPLLIYQRFMKPILAAIVLVLTKRFRAHGGNADSFLSEFQFAFAQWFVTQSTGTADETAFARWRHLVLATYNAGERRMTAAPELFAGLADSLMGQYDLLPNDWFTPDSFIASGQASYLAEDMIDSDVPILVEKGKAFAAYLQKRRG